MTMQNDYANMDAQSELYSLYAVNMEELMTDPVFQAEYTNWIDEVYEKDNRD